ncbi:MAG: hypothetical protein EDM69_02580 [Chlorobiota bacterium]|nr:MAG: hypothetical protein EDM69_02580 [Chlorobiota bacterium]MCE7952510.1 hypothetical protein [Chlorobi bacterium CHB7]OQY77272.1 MAG: hypothetical protein B6D43_06595 [Ignavibacteriales bacterium UTCHB1]
MKSGLRIHNFFKLPRVLPVSKEFHDFIESATGFIDNDNKRYTDIMELCRGVPRLAISELLLSTYELCKSTGLTANVR